MLQPKTQADIVNNFMVQLEQGQEITDRIYIPASVTGLFTLPVDRDNSVKVENVKIPGVIALYNHQYEDIASVLISLMECRQGVVGLSWKVSSDQVAVSFVPTGTTSLKITKESLLTMLKNILKARSKVSEVNWDFRKDYIELTFVA